MCVCVCVWWPWKKKSNLIHLKVIEGHLCDMNIKYLLYHSETKRRQWLTAFPSHLSTRVQVNFLSLIQPCIGNGCHCLYSMEAFKRTWGSGTVLFSSKSWPLFLSKRKGHHQARNKWQIWYISFIFWYHLTQPFLCGLIGLLPDSLTKVPQHSVVDSSQTKHIGIRLGYSSAEKLDNTCL